MEKCKFAKYVGNGDEVCVASPYHIFADKGCKKGRQCFVDKKKQERKEKLKSLKDVYK